MLEVLDCARRAFLERGLDCMRMALLKMRLL